MRPFAANREHISVVKKILDVGDSGRYDWGMNQSNPIGNFQTVEVRKDELIGILNENKERHISLYNAALSGYYDKVKGYYDSLAKYSSEHGEKYAEIAGALTSHSLECQQRISDAPDFGKPVKIVEYPKLEVKLALAKPASPIFPTSYESYYNDSIRKLQLSVHDVFSLSEVEFQRFVMNNWEWKQAFLGNSYSNLVGTQHFTGYIGSGCVSGILDRY
jgi:hypothetical protein